MAKTTKFKRPPIGNETIDISEASLKQDIENSDELEELENEFENQLKSENEEYLKNVQDTKTIKISDIGKIDENETATIDFLDEKAVNDFTSSQSKESSSTSNGNSFDNKSVEDIQEEIKKAESQTEKLSPKDFEDIARFIIFLIDASMATALKWWSKDTSDSAYSLPEKKKEQLVYQLTMILVKYQAKFSLEFMFLITVIILYIPGFLKARERRAELKKTSTIPVVKKQEQQNVVFQESNNKNENNINEQPQVFEVVKPTSRKRGAPKKI